MWIENHDQWSHDALVRKCESMGPAAVRTLRFFPRTPKGDALLEVWDAGHIDDAGRWVSEAKP